MRLSSILLVGAAVLVVRCHAVSTITESEQNQISTVTGPVKKAARFLRTTETENEDDDDLDSEDEERLNLSFLSKWLNTADDATAAAAKKLQPQQVAKLSKVDDVKPSYPFLLTEKQAVESAKNFDDQFSAQLRQSKSGKELLANINTTPGAAARISRWNDADLDPAAVKNILKDYPTLMTKTSSEKQALDLYYALFMRQHFSVK